MESRAPLAAILAGLAAALAGLAGLALLAGCAKRPAEQWVREALAPSPGPESQWTRYHWYYPEITHSLKVNWSSEGHYSGPVAHVHLQMAAKALTQEGAAHVGLLHLEGWNNSVKFLEVIHLDSAGRRMPVPMERVKATFREKGIIVVPRVGRGSTVSVRLIQGPFSSINYWELPMDRSVPVLKGQLRLTAGKGIGFDTKAYNGLQGPFLERASRFGPPTQVWTAREVMPLADLPHADGMTARPRFLLTNRNNAHGTRLATWQAVAREKRKHEFAPGLLNLSGETEAQAKALAAEGGDEAAKARRLLAWVQDKLTVAPERTGGLGPDAVLERRKGTEEQLAALLKSMYDAAGLPCEIVLTRRRGLGGLDPEAANPNAASTPLLIVKAGGREWAAYPPSPSYDLGDYPSGFIGMQALSLESGGLRALPEPVHGTSLLSVRQEITLEGLPVRKAVVELEGPAAAEARSDWIDALAGDPLEGCRATLRAQGFIAGIRKCAQQGLEDRGRPFRLELVLENAGSWLEEEHSRTWTAPDLFTRPAWFYDSARVDEYYFPHDLARRETVVFLGPKGKTLQARIPCRDLENPFLKVTCRQEGTAAEPSFTRETLVRKGRYAAAELKSLHADLAGLDRIRDARFTAR